LDDITYPVIPFTSIPKGVALAPVTIEDLGTGLKHKTTMVAGSVGMTATAIGSGKDLTIVQPRSGWWMLEDSVGPILGNPKQQEVVSFSSPTALSGTSGSSFYNSNSFAPY
jgi:hypothetical protein